VVDPRFDLWGGVFLKTGGWGCRKTLKVLTDEIKVICYTCIGPISINVLPKTKNEREKQRLGHKQIIGPRPLGRGAPDARPLDPLLICI